MADTAPEIISTEPESEPEHEPEKIIEKETDSSKHTEGKIIVIF